MTDVSARDGGRMLAVKGCSEEKSSLVGRVWGGISDCPLCVEGDVFRIIIIQYEWLNELTGNPGLVKNITGKLTRRPGGDYVDALLGTKQSGRM